MRKRRWPGWGPSEQAEQHYLIQPRALAGGGDIRHVSEFLRASGWQHKSRNGGPLVMESADRAIRLSYDPYVQPGGWMIQARARGEQAEWWALFGRQTPVEIIAGLTDALTQPRSAHAPNVWAPLAQQDWVARAEGRHYTATSPDEAAWLHFRQDGEGNAMWWSGARDEQGNGWTAQFSASTPLHLVQAFSTALASPEPVMRPRGRVPHSSKIQTTSVSVLPSQLGAWQQARIAAARAAAWARNSARGPRPTTARPHAKTGAFHVRR
ncbi:MULTISPECIES: DUF317 domain-containing protein [Streptomyces]|uniref:DUF317 domain-containing protein n=1 Tax=Streptomyces eurythermus TaxID=42237 RepID=A0ABW6Z5M1_9ACTN|nr:MULTISPECIES: DUF317 domain-containing protein [Streptomyces]QIS75018.1 DUF317 domain-containing protein [Streptomyces sp. DSM 40868]